MKRYKSKDTKAIVTCKCGHQTTLGAIDEGYGALLANDWLCPSCWDIEAKKIEELWGSSLLDDIPF